MFEKTQLKNGVNLYLRPTSQFKTLNFSFKWKHSLNEKSAAERSVLANVMQHSNEKYPTTAALRAFLDDLYGTVAYTDVAKRRDSHVFTLNVECVNEQFLSDDNVLSQVLDLIHTIIFKPNFENGKFKQSIVEREKESIIQRIESIYDDKTRYAQQRMLQLLRPNHPASVAANGTIEEVKSVTIDSLMSMYNELIKSDEVDIYVVGDFDANDLAKELTNRLPFPERTKTVDDSTSLVLEPKEEVNHVSERQDMKQGKLHIGFSTPISFTHEDFPKMQITNGIFGGYSHSKLFMNVREKESMAYYVSSSYAANYGLIYVLAGIDAELEEKAVALVKEQLDELKAGNISDLEIEQTVALLKNSLREALDSARGQIAIYDQYKVLSENFSIDDWVKKWSSVTKEDVKQMASNIQMEIVYLLSGKEEK